MKIMKKLKKSNGITHVDFLIVGTGNIALRHVKNIRGNYKNKKIAICKRTNTELNKEFYDLVDYLTNDIEYIKPSNNKSISIICSPAPMHINDSLTLANNGFNLLIEKPLATNNINTTKLFRLCNKYNLKTLIGYNMRFSDLYHNSEKLIKKNGFGKIYSITIYAGSNYKYWRKNKSYLKSVSANKSLGGGVIYELSHEIDYMQSFFGLPRYAYVTTNKSKIKKVDVETNITALFSFPDKDYNICMHLNMLAENTNRYCKIEYDLASMNIDFTRNTLTIEKNSKVYSQKKYKDTVDITYIRELKHLKQCIKNNSDSILPIKKGLKTHNIINAMYKSLQEGKPVKILK